MNLFSVYCDSKSSVDIEKDPRNVLYVEYTRLVSGFLYLVYLDKYMNQKASVNITSNLNTTGIDN